MNQRRPRFILPTAFALCLVVAPSYAQTLDFHGLGFIGGGGSSPYSTTHGMNSDGSVVVGTSSNAANQYEAFRWTTTGGIQGLGFIGGGGNTPNSEAYGISADGSVIVGSSTNAADQSEAFQWTAAGGMEGLGFLGIPSGGSAPSSGASGVSADGSVIVGSSTNAADQSEAFRWTASGGMQGLGHLGAYAGFYFHSTALDVSADGSVVVGQSSNSADQFEAFRWTSAGGMEGLGFIGGGSGGISSLSVASAVSVDGAVIVGYSTNTANQTEAFRWTTAVGMQGLGFIGGGGSAPGSSASGVSADGSVIVGASTNAADQSEAFRWTAASGMQSVADMLTIGGAPVGTWQLSDAISISGDGSIIIGNGLDPLGNRQAWIVRIIPPIPPETETPEGPRPPPVVGFITPVEINATIADTAKIALHSSTTMATTLADMGFATREQCRAERPDDARFCAFITGSAAFWGNNGDLHKANRLGGSIGIAAMLAPGLQAGLAFNAGKGKYDLRLGGSNDLTSYGGSAFLSYAPSGRDGLQLTAIASLAQLDLDITRNYMNGVAVVSQSKGSTNGQAAGVLGRIGWGFKALEQTWLTPFAEVEWLRARNGAYNETGGVFPVQFSSQSVRETNLRLGTEIRHNLTASMELFGSLALVHRLSGQANALNGVMVNAFDVTSGNLRLKSNWAEASAGASWSVTPQTRVSGSVSVSLGASNRPAATMRVGAATAF